MHPARDTKSVTTGSPQETWALAAELLKELCPGAVIALHGDRGSGKTCFVQGLAEAMGVQRPVGSPTFTLVNEYDGAACVLHHIDLYRISGPREALGLGLDEYLHGDGITAIEWAERAAELLPAGTIHVEFCVGDKPDERVIRIRRGENA